MLLNFKAINAILVITNVYADQKTAFREKANMISVDIFQRTDNALKISLFYSLARKNC